MLIKIANYFGVSIDYLIGNDVGVKNLVYVPKENLNNLAHILFLAIIS